MISQNVEVFNICTSIAVKAYILRVKGGRYNSISNIVIGNLLRADMKIFHDYSLGQNMLIL